jgi:hypothetical protein
METTTRGRPVIRREERLENQEPSSLAERLALREMDTHQPVIGQAEVIIEADLAYTSDEVVAATRANQRAMSDHITEMLRP